MSTLFIPPSQFLKDLTLQSRAVGTNVCQLLTPIVFITFAGVMQIILNIILRDHGTPVPGSSPILIPMDVSRSLACETDGSAFNNPEIISPNGTFNITNCHDNLFNFFTEHPNITNINNTELREFINDLSILLNITLPVDKIMDQIMEEEEELKNISIFSLARPQDLLFNLPMFYIGK